MKSGRRSCQSGEVFSGIHIRMGVDSTKGDETVIDKVTAPEEANR
jgi:hypothetical protein